MSGRAPARALGWVGVVGLLSSLAACGGSSTELTWEMDAAVNSDSGAAIDAAPVDALDMDANRLAAPTGVDAVAGDGEIFVGWDPVPGATIYAVYGDESPSLDPTTAPLLARTQRTFFEHTDLIRGVERFYIVVAETDDRVSLPSEEVSATPAETQAPTAAIVFPPRLSSFSGDRLTVRGVAADEHAVAAVRVNGVDATSDDGFATWRAEVPIAGSVHLVVSTEDRVGNVNPMAAVADVGADPGVGESFYDPGAISIDADGRLIVSDWHLDGFLSVDPSSGDRTLLSRAIGAGGENMDYPYRTVIRGAVAYTVSPLQRTIFATDLTSNFVSVFASASTNPAAVQRPYDVLYDAVADRLLVIDGDLGALRSFDPVTGDDVEISGARGSGPALTRSVSLALSEDRATVWVGLATGVVIAVDRASGDRTLVYDTGPRPIAPVDVRVDVATGLAYVFDQGRIFEVPIDGSAATVVTPALGNADAFEVDFPGRRAWIIINFNLSLREVFEVDLDTGASRLVADNSDPGPMLDDVNAATWSPVAGLLYLLDRGELAVYSVDPATGERALVSGADRGSGARLISPNGMTLRPDGAALYITDTGDDSIIRVDLPSGDRTRVSSPTVGEGTAFASPFGIRWMDTDRVLVSDPSVRRLFEVRVDTGGRSAWTFPNMQVDSIHISAGRVFALRRNGDSVLELDVATQNRRELYFGEPTQIALDREGRLGMVDSPAATLFRLDPAAGHTAALSHFQAGRGEGLVEPRGLVLDSSGEYWLVSDGTLRAILAIDVVSGDRVVMSR